ncbi:MAG TPA: glycosyltransferase family 2 protein [Duganella sp.]|jgi:cellulose synthase/poly-beta-1,6-N-acetylglucosamine synthase-like glycosyltransferase
MTFMVATLLTILLAIILIPIIVLLLQSLSAFFAAHTVTGLAGARPRIAVLVPAHNEEAGLAATLASLMPQLQAGDRVLVVADNCADDTAGVARRAGADVRERRHATERGKGYALDFGVRALAADAPEVLIIIDADCLVADGALAKLAHVCATRQRPVQALYLMYAPGGSLMKKIAEFAWVVKNQVRPLGFHRLGLPCQLMGTGMAFPWSIISTASLANGHIVEDMKLGLDLALAGTPPLFCPDALVSSTFPTSNSGTDTQRTRWEHGHLSMIVSEAPRLLWRGLAKGSVKSVAMALDLSVPPVALLCLLTLAVSALAALLAVFTGAHTPLLLAVAALAGLGLAVLLAWLRFGRAILSAGDLLTAVLYMFAKIPLYLRFLINRQVEWVRSKRDNE